MKLLLKSFLFLFALVIFENKSLSLTDHRIRVICKNRVEKATCIKNFRERRFNLKKGNYIEIPVIPYKGKQNF